MSKNAKGFLLVLLIGCALLAAHMLWAQTPPGPVTAVDETAQQQMSLEQIIRTGGPLMYVLAVMSVVALTFVFFFLITLRVGQIAPTALKRELTDKMRAGQLDEVRALCGLKACPLSSVALTAINYVQSVQDPESSVMKDLIEGEGARHAVILQGRTQYLLDVAVIAPMVGLLGTVLGMLEAFNTVALDLAKAKPMLLAAGVSKALITTAGGLMVGIPAMVAYAFFRGRVSKLVSHLEVAAADVLTALIGERKS